MKCGADILIKLDGDGQMEHLCIKHLIQPIKQGAADYAKGHRFTHLSHVRSMPLKRLIGNIVSSFITKMSTVYWHLLDSTNGFIAIHRNILAYLPAEKIERRFFFETDLLNHLSQVNAIVRDVPIKAHYDNKKSSLSILRVLPEFTFKHLLNMTKRTLYAYFIDGFNMGRLHFFRCDSLFLDFFSVYITG